MDSLRLKSLWKKLTDSTIPWWFRPFTGSVIAAGIVSFLAWGPARWFLFSFIPDNAESGWIFKLGITIVVGWVGGIFIPIGIIIIGVILWMELPKLESWRI